MDTQTWLKALSKKKPDKLYTIPVDYVFDLILDAEEQAKGAKELVRHLVESDELEKNEYVFVLACEIAAAASSILRLINKEIETAVLLEDSKEIVILQATLQSLQTLVLSKYYANNDLTKTAYSVTYH